MMSIGALTIMTLIIIRLFRMRLFIAIKNRVLSIMPLGIKAFSTMPLIISRLSITMKIKILSIM
jgi:hypothetical protein